MRSVGRFVGCVAAVMGLLALVVAPAWAIDQPISLIGGDGIHPSDAESFVLNSRVEATLDEKLASGSLEVESKVQEMGIWHYRFRGEVTCMHIEGKRVTVGAFGTVVKFPIGPPPVETPLEGKYADVLTVEFGTFPPYIPGGRAPTDDFAFLEPLYGVPASEPPSCAHASFEDQWPGYGGAFYMSPTITRPRSGRSAAQRGMVLAGTGEPGRALVIHQTGQSSGTYEVTVNPADDHWALQLGGLARGTYEFVADAVDGSTVPSNTVEVFVR
jgi:hypothetical protein